MPQHARKSDYAALGRSEGRRPPGALEEAAFLDRCDKCFDCIEVCPVKALGSDADLYPCIPPDRICIECGLCADICTRGAIRLTPRTRAGLKRVLEEERRLYRQR